MRLYSLSSGSFVAEYTIPERDRAASGDGTRLFQGVIQSPELPAVRLLLVIVDQISCTGACIPIDVTDPGPDYSEIRARRSAATTIYLGVAAVLLAAPGTGPGLMLRQS